MDGAADGHGRVGGPLVGREEILREVEALLERTRGGQGGGLLLTGTDGAGKSRLLRVVVERASARDLRVLEARALPQDLPAPFSLFRDLLATPGRSEESPPPFPLEPAGLPPILVPTLPSVEPTAPSDHVIDRPTAAAPDELERMLAPLGSTAVEGLGASRDELLGRLHDRLRRLAGEGPVVLAIDDLHFADASSLEVLARLAPDLYELPLALVATCGLAGAVPPSAKPWLDALGRARGVRTAPVGPLSVSEVSELVRSILGGQEPDPAEVLRWHAETDGNPLFVELLVGAETGYGPSVSEQSEAGAITLTGTLLRRAASLDEGERRLLTYGAVTGLEFRLSTLRGVAKLSEEALRESLNRLVAVGLLRARRDDTYEFVSEAVRSHLYSALTETRRRILHRKVGEALVATGEGGDPERARQFYLGRDDPRALEYNLRAAEAATRAFAFETAAAHLARALEVERRLTPNDRRAEVRLLTEIGRLWDEVGDVPRSAEALREAVGLARRPPTAELELGRALLGLAQTECDRSEYDRAEALAAEAQTLLERVGTPRDRMAAHRVQGVVYWRRGDLARAEQHQRAALEIAEAEGTPLERGHALVDVANTMVPAGPARFESALALYARAADLFATVEDFGARARVLMNRAVLEYGAGRPDEAFRDLATALEAAERSRSPIWIGYCQLNLAQWHAEQGQPELARAPLERADRVLAPVGDRLADQQVAMTRGMLAEAEGTLDLAEAHYEDALARARAMRMAAELCEMLFRMAQLAHRRGYDAEARSRAAEARAAGLPEHRPDLLPRLVALERELGVP